MKSALNLTKSVEANRAHLQAEVRNKEAENNHLTAQLQVQQHHGYIFKGEYLAILQMLIGTYTKFSRIWKEPWLSKRQRLMI